MTFLTFFQLITPPVNMRALAILSAVTGDSLTSHLGKILPAMLNAIQDCFGTEDEKEVSERMTPCMLKINYFAIFLVAESSPTKHYLLSQNVLIAQVFSCPPFI